MRKRTLLNVEQLEDRLTPTAFGQPWPNAEHLTLSFVPDGTDAGGSPSNLFSTLNAIAPTANWETEVLRAFQTWLSNSNINVGVVADNGLPLGTTGAVEGDSRFGDIRIAAKALPPVTISTATPFSWTGSTWSGDIILNSTYQFGINGHGQYDLYTVLLHEAGHVFGLEDTAVSTGSAMYPDYIGSRTGLISQDITDLQALYGPRNPDSFDSNQVHNTFATAAVVFNSWPDMNAKWADITTPTDVDYFQISTPGNSDLTGMTWTVHTSGASLLVPSLTICDSSQKVVASASAASPLKGDITLNLKVKNSSTYYIQVSANSSIFGIGSYWFSVNYQFKSYTPPPPSAPASFTFVNNNDQNNSFGNAIDLGPNNMSTRGFNYLYGETIGSSSDKDFFKLTSPQISGTSLQTMTVIAWAAQASTLYPVVHVFDSQTNPQVVEIVNNSDGTYTVQLANVVPNANYYIEVAPLWPTGPNNLGNYTVGVFFSNSPPIAQTQLGSNQLATPASTESATFTMAQNGLFQFILETANGSTSSTAVVNMTITDQNGNVVLSIDSTSGQPPTTAVVYLAAGNYAINYRVKNTSGTYVPVTYWLLGEILSDPIGPYYTSSSSTNTGNNVVYTGPNSGGPRPYYY